LVCRAQDARLDLKAAHSAVRAAEAQIAIQKRRALPDVSVGPAIERSEDEGSDALIGGGGTITLPVFDQNQAQVARAEYEATKLRKMYEDLSISIGQGVRAAADRATAAARTATFMRNELLPQAQQSVDLARRSYELGDTTLLTLLESQRTAIQARQSYLDARLDAAQTISNLERTASAPMASLLSPTPTVQPEAAQ
jgi:outer membrane protein, heavy metal efflux system